MNSNEGVFLFIFSIVTMNVICCGFGQYEPLYMPNPVLSREYYLIYNVRYNIADQKLFVVESLGGNIISLCPRTNDTNSLEIRQKEPAKILFIPDECETSIKSDIYILRAVFEDLSNYSSVIGFLLFTPDRNLESVFNDVPQNHKVVEFIHFRFDKSLRRIRYVKYEIGTGKHLKPEISAQTEDNEYQKNENIFGYDVDKLYSQSELPMAKVQLAPEDDFFYANLKSASRHNILTAPMWRDLLPQWQALEIFTRKVTQIINSVEVKTGVHDTLTKSRTARSPRTIYLHDEKHPIPKYFWKIIYIEIRLEFNVLYTYGILFVMHNVDPNAKSSEQKICPDDDLSKMGWDFLPDNEFKSLMYACFYNEVNLKFFHQEINDHAVPKNFDLHEVPVRETDDEGKLTDEIRRINVIEEMQKFKEATDDFMKKYLASLNYTSN